jgi:hypothetical protein
MSESELLQATLSAASNMLTTFSVFFGIVSAYVVALYLFLHQAPLAMRVLAFLMLTLAFLFIIAMGWHIQYLGEGIHHAWAGLKTKTTGMATLGPPTIMRTLFVDGREVTALFAWSLALTVYVLLGFLTFFYRWPHGSTAE